MEDLIAFYGWMDVIFRASGTGFKDFLEYGFISTN